MNRINRAEAVRQVCNKQLSMLDTQHRESHILDWWNIDEGDAEFSLLSVELQNQILKSDEPPSDSENYKYNQLILIALQAKLKGVTNTFLSESMAMNGLGKNEICGELEQLHACPCCEYRTLNTQGEYEICGLCGWEDDGINEITRYSGPNHMTLGEAKGMFIENMEELPLSKWVKAQDNRI